MGLLRFKQKRARAGLLFTVLPCCFLLLANCCRFLWAAALLDSVVEFMVAAAFACLAASIAACQDNAVGLVAGEFDSRPAPSLGSASLLLT